MPGQPARRIPVLLCEGCHDELEESVDVTEIDSDERGDECALCEGEGAFEVSSVQIDEESIEALRKSIHACEQEGCGGGTWDSEDGDVIGADTNTSIGDQLIECIPDTTTFGKLILWLVESDDVSLVEWPELACRACGAELDGWGTEVKTRIHQTLVDRLPEPPPEIAAITTKSPAEAIEWWRSDCSTYLVHLTRGAPVGVLVDNIDYEPKIEQLSAPELLWIILTDRTLKAKRGKGMRSSAVCFTEKPLTALKDTVLGAEARVRRGKRALRWPAYGLMFEKDYLRGLGVRPVIHVDPTDAAKLPPELAYRAVTLKGGTNWLHEREWRAAADIRFDLAKCIVLVPTFEQAELFRSALGKRGVSVRGFLPLHDLFAAL